MSRKARKFKAFFRPKLGDLQKKKRSSPKFSVIFWLKFEIQSFFPPKIRCSPPKKKKRSSPKLRLLFRPISQIQTFEGGLFSNGGGYFPFFTQNRPQKHKKHAILHTSQANGGLEPPRPPPPPPWLRYWLCLLQQQLLCIFLNVKIFLCNDFNCC